MAPHATHPHFHPKPTIDTQAPPQPARERLLFFFFPSLIEPLAHVASASEGGPRKVVNPFIDGVTG